MAPRYLDRPTVDLADADGSLLLPYGLTAQGLVTATSDLYAYLHALNAASIEHGYDRLEDIMLPAGFSGLLSELAVRAIARENEHGVPGVTKNQYANGRPDLVPRALYPNDAVLRGPEGIELKVSGNAASWQGHNPETGWVMVIQILVDRSTHPVYDRSPTTVERILIASLSDADWTFSGRSETSRRTPTASINKGGRGKLSSGVVYQRGRSKGLVPPAVPFP